MTAELVAIPVEVITDIPVEAIDIGENPRGDVGDLGELAASIRRRGVLEPIRVRAHGDRYRLVYGKRRLLASRMAGRATIPAIVAGADGQNDLADALVENIQRKDLTPIEEAQAIEELHKLGHSEIEIGAMIGRSQGHVSNRRRLLRCDPSVVEDVASGRLAATQAILMATLPHAQQRVLAARSQRENWDQDRLREALRPHVIPPGRPPKEPRSAPPARGADAYVAILGQMAGAVPTKLARVLLWTLVEMDVLAQRRFEERHRSNAEEVWKTIDRLPPEALASELAQTTAGFVADYGSLAVRASLAGRTR